MEFVDAAGLTRVSLQPVSYEFSAVSGDKWDDNWLIISGSIATPQERRSFREPCLLVEDAEEIARWLELVATGQEHLSDSDISGDGEPQLEFLEPNLAFSSRPNGTAGAIIRIHFAWSFQLNRREPADGQSSDEFWAAEPAESRVAAAESAIARTTVDFKMSFAAIGRAAAQWRKELVRFPTR